MDGWIKIHRKLLDWEWYDDGNVVRVFLHLLLTANFEPKKWHGIILERGQLATSVANLASQVKLSAKQIRIVLEKLKNTNEIGIQTTNKYTIITICKYADYQSQETSEGQTNGKQTANKGQTEDKQRATTKEIKKEIKKESSIDYAQAVELLPESMKDAVLMIADEIEVWIDYKKKEFRKSYKTESTFAAFLKRLFSLAGGNPDTMKAIIEQSIANRYEGIFSLKSNNNGNYNNPRSADYVPTERIVAAGFAMAKAGM